MERKNEVSDVRMIPTGEWFLGKDGKLYLKMLVFTRKGKTYEAVDIIRGDPAFPDGEESGELTVIEKPDQVIPASGSLRFDLKQNRNIVAQSLRDAFPNVVFIEVNKPGAFFLEYATTLDVHRLIQK